ncbi:MAG: phosphate-binding protein [Phormidesmis priestleyi]|uniref:Phosphate-binding protein n=1 Tax=Phormidesmis priestleyi TaxID=268141 RepID=A0A2W4WGX5_9CYAN|nr:MAG: phosphate-binding protein [Phormidesmis priestleyi]
MQFKSRPARLAYSVSILALVASLSACGGGDTTTAEGDPAAAGGEGGEEITGSIQIDGSSTVFPISEAVAEEFQSANPGTQVTVGVSGTGGGFEKFCAGQTDISNASRPIKEEEAAACEAAGIEYIEAFIAYDGLTVIANTENDFAECLTVEQLNTAWGPEAEGKVTNWNQIDPSFPDRPLALFAPGTASGTFDYFTEVVGGESGASRGDYTASEDDNVIVNGVESSDGSLGYLGYAYYVENEGALKALEIENEEGNCVAPTPETIADGSYNPLSRPIFFYVKKESYDSKPQVKAFVDYHLRPESSDLVSEVGYIPLPEDVLTESRSKVEQGVTGKSS